MCKECGCDAPNKVTVIGPGDATLSTDQRAMPSATAVSAAVPQGPANGATPLHAHQHGEDEPPDREESRGHVIDISQSLLTKNDRLAERNRGFFRAKQLLVLNVLSSPGSGKTTLIEKTAVAAAGRLRAGVIVGDLATDNDAQRLRAAGIPVVQVNTGTMCHLDAAMIEQACRKLDLDAIDILIIENVGNLVCPAVYDLGEDLRVVLLSVTEGEDKPLKYPPAFHSADAALVTKLDLARAVEWDRTAALANLRRIAHHATVFELSAKSGEGMENWIGFLLERRQRTRGAGLNHRPPP